MHMDDHTGAGPSGRRGRGPGAIGNELSLSRGLNLAYFCPPMSTKALGGRLKEGVDKRFDKGRTLPYNARHRCAGNLR